MRQLFSEGNCDSGQLVFNCNSNYQCQESGNIRYCYDPSDSETFYQPIAAACMQFEEDGFTELMRYPCEPPYSSKKCGYGNSAYNIRMNDVQTTSHWYCCQSSQAYWNQEGDCYSIETPSLPI